MKNTVNLSFIVKDVPSSLSTYLMPCLLNDGQSSDKIAHRLSNNIQRILPLRPAELPT